MKQSTKSLDFNALADSKGWLPGRRDVPQLFEAWTTLPSDLRERLIKKLSKMDGPASNLAMKALTRADAPRRQELTRPVLKSVFRSLKSENPAAPEADILGECGGFLSSNDPRVVKSAAQAIASSWVYMSQDLRRQLLEHVKISFGKVVEPSAKRALMDALGNSADESARGILSRSNEASHASERDRALLKLSRDLSAPVDDSDRCHPESFSDAYPIVLWFTIGIEQVAKNLGLFKEFKIMTPGVAVVKGTIWGDLKSNLLWRRAGIRLGDLNQPSAEALAQLVGDHADLIQEATTRTSRGPVRLRLGRGSDVGRSLVWDFGKKLMAKDCGVICDGRSAHWQIELVGKTVVLVPKACVDERFVWRDTSIEGASDPTIAAAIVLLADVKPTETVYDPFCGAGSELIIAGKSLPRLKLIGTDTSQEALNRAKTAAAKADQSIQFYCDDACKFQKGPFDVVITNPPFGMRTTRGEARPVLENFFKNISYQLSQNGRVVLLSHAPSATVEWALAAGLKFSKAMPVWLGRMRCELQCFVRR
jgi:SAM-dependent methyltransferase